MGVEEDQAALTWCRLWGLIVPACDAARNNLIRLVGRSQI